MDPIFIYVMAVIFIAGPLIAVWYVRRRRGVQRWISDWIEKMLDTRHER
jgi:hypothetical protein